MKTEAFQDNDRRTRGLVYYGQFRDKPFSQQAKQAEAFSLTDEKKQI